MDLYDFTYDGLVQDNYLKGGLGQLTDGDYGETNFRLDTKKMGVKGYEWVGWKNDTNRQEPITVFFKFDTVRNFSQVRELVLARLRILDTVVVLLLLLLISMGNMQISVTMYILLLLGVLSGEIWYLIDQGVLMLLLFCFCYY